MKLKLFYSSNGRIEAGACAFLLLFFFSNSVKNSVNCNSVLQVKLCDKRHMIKTNQKKHGFSALFFFVVFVHLFPNFQNWFLKYDIKEELKLLFVFVLDIC